MLRTLVTALGVSAVLAGSAHAAACGDEATRLAAEFRLSADVPAIETDKGTATVPPAPPVTVESRGLLGTDRIGAPIEAPEAATPRTPSLGRLPPPPGDELRPPPPRGAPDRPAMPPGPAGFSPGDRQKAEALLASARQADAAGRPQDCRRQVDEAKKLLPGDTPR